MLKLQAQLKRVLLQILNDHSQKSSCKAVKALLDNDQQAFVQVCNEKSKIEDYQTILSVLTSTYGWECNPGSIIRYHNKDTQMKKLSLIGLCIFNLLIFDASSENKESKSKVSSSTIENKTKSTKPKDQAVEETSSKHVQLEIDSYKMSVMVDVNDIPVYTCKLPLAHKELSINQWATNDSNTFKIYISAESIEPGKMNAPTLDMIIALYENTQTGSAKKVLKEIHWKYDENTKFPVNIEENVIIDIPYGNWAWRDADILNKQNLNLISLKQYITQIHTSLQNKDYANLAPLLEVKTTELAIAYGIPTDERLKDQKDTFVKELFKDPKWGLLPLDLNDLSIKYYAKGKLIEVLNKKGETIIQSKSLIDDVTFGIDLFLCYKNNQWILCR